MPLKTFLFNRGIFSQIVRNVGWVALVYFVGLLFALPIHIFMMTEDENWLMHHQTGRIFDIGSIIQFSLMFTLPVLLAIFLFRYMQVRLSADYIHSLPVKREALFLQHIVTAMIILTVPVAMIAGCLIIMKPLLPVSLYSLKHIAIWFTGTLAMNVLLFSGTVFVGMFTGMSMLQGVFAYVLFFFSAGIFVLLMFNLKYFLHGFAYEYYLSYNIDKIAPFIRALTWESKPIQPIEIYIYIVLAFIFYVLSVWLYKKRHVEAATDAIAFRPLRPVFTYGFTFCVMLVGGAYFGEMQQRITWIIFGYVFASLIGYFIARIILEKTWRVFTHWKAYVQYIGFIAVVSLLFAFDLFGFGKYQPPLNDIERAYFGDDIYYFENDNENGENAFFYERDNIEHIYLFHQQLMKQQKLQTENTKHVVIGYDLKNGKRIVRQYAVPLEVYNQFYKPIFHSLEFKKNHYPILRINDFKNVLQVRIDSNLGGKAVRLRDREEIESFLHILQRQLVDETFDPIAWNREWGAITVTYEKQKGITEETMIKWKKSYHLVDEWLQQRGLLQQARATVEDVSEVKIIKNTKRLKTYEWTDDMIERAEGIVVKDKTKIEQCMQMAGWDERADYIVVTYYKSGYADIQSFTKHFIPPFLH